tara:strand:- start:171 stop:374 length:204 start_codon:yes stop_codon:yes gene_type:complete
MIDNLSDKTKFDDWIKNCPIDDLEVLSPTVETQDKNGDWCYLVPVYVLIKRDKYGKKLYAKEEYSCF